MTNRERFNTEVTNEELAKMLARFFPNSNRTYCYFPFKDWAFDEFWDYDVWDMDNAIQKYADWLGEEC